jgi:hypothetical protein
MNMITSTAIAGTAITAQAGAAADPIYAAIAAHVAAYDALCTCLDEHFALERELPMDRQQSSVNSWEEKIVETDDPRWIQMERRVNAMHDAEIDASMELINVEPTTVAGAAALLKRVVAMEVKGWSWPSGLQEEDAKPTALGKSWETYLHQNLSALLSRLAA